MGAKFRPRPLQPFCASGGFSQDLSACSLQDAVDAHGMPSRRGRPSGQIRANVLKHRKHAMANRTSQARSIGVRGIFLPDYARPLADRPAGGASDRCLPHHRANQPNAAAAVLARADQASLGGHSAHTAPAGAAQKTHEHGFDLIFRVVTDGHEANTSGHGQFREFAVSGTPCRGLQVSHVAPAYFDLALRELQAQPEGERPYCIPVG